VKATQFDRKMIANPLNADEYMVTWINNQEQVGGTEPQEQRNRDLLETGLKREVEQV
jgi:hypothetical protein